MKPSHTTTPRTLEQCKFNPSDAMFEVCKPKRSNTLADTIVVIACALAGLAVVVLMVLEHIKNNGLPLP